MSFESYIDPVIETRPFDKVACSLMFPSNGDHANSLLILRATTVFLAVLAAFLYFLLCCKFSLPFREVSICYIPLAHGFWYLIGSIPCGGLLSILF
jgi:hypothetical protein